MFKGSFSKILIPGTTVFLSSACIMIIELVASRLIAKHLGSSLYTWTSVIGVVLAGITIGNYLGGRIADKFQARKTLSTLFCLASIACIAIIVLNNIIGEWFWLYQLSWPLRVFGHVASVFLLPSVLLGTISPVVAKMALDQGLPAGRTVGDIYAFGAAGSIAGTFLAGFYLIAAMGTIAIIWTVAFCLLLMALTYRIKAWPVYLWAITLVILFFLGSAKTATAKQAGAAMLLREKPDPTVLYEDETRYGYVAVRQIPQNPNVRVFMQDALMHSKISMDNVADLQYFYTRIFAALTMHATNNMESPSFLSIGGGGYVFSRFLQEKWPGSLIDVAEIDPGVTEAAHAAFGLPRDTSINTITLDASNHIDNIVHKNQTKEDPLKYDVIIGDAFNDYNVPFQLVTFEFNEKVKSILSQNGLYLMNLIDFDSYGNAQFLGAVVSTLRKSFPYVYVLDEDNKSLPENRDTFVVAASFKPFDPVALVAAYDPAMKVRFLDGADSAHLPGKLRRTVLTNDNAPVENLLAPVVRQNGKEFLAQKKLFLAQMNLSRGAELIAKGNFKEAIASFKKAATIDPLATYFAYGQIGILNTRLNKPEEALKAFKIAVDYYDKHGITDPGKIGTIHLHMALIYQSLGNAQGVSKHCTLAITHLKKAVTLEPENHDFMDCLAQSYVMARQMELAATYFRKALQLAPHNHQYYNELISVLEFQNRIDEAISVLREQQNLFRKQGNQKGVQQVEQHLQQLDKKQQLCGKLKRKIKGV